MSLARNGKECAKYILAAAFWVLVLITLSAQSTILPEHQAWGQTHTQAELLEEVQLIEDLLLKYHIDLDFYTPKSTLDSVFHLIEQSLYSDMSTMAFYNELLVLNKYIANIHTAFVPPEAIWTSFKTTTPLFPLLVYSQSDSLFVVADESQEKQLEPGTQLVSINGKPVAEILHTFQSNLKRDARNLTFPFRRAYYSFALLYARTYGLCSQFDVELITPQGLPKVAVLEARENMGQDVLQSAHYSTIYLPTYGNDTLPVDLVFRAGIPVLKVSTFHVSSLEKAGINYKKTFRLIFKKLQQEGHTKLVIDLRDNTGGQPEPVAELLSYLLEKPFRINREIGAQVNHIDEADGFDADGRVEMFNATDWKANGTLFALDEKQWQREQKPSADAFTGQLTVLINGFTNSAAGTFAGQLTQRSKVLFLGEETGGNPHRTVARQIVKKTLPYTGIQLHLPLVRSVKHVQVAHQDRGVIPDLSLQASIEDILHKKDVVLEWAIRQ